MSFGSVVAGEISRLFRYFGQFPGSVSVKSLDNRSDEHT